MPYRYNKHNIVSFGKTDGRFGGLSNMAPDYALFVNEICIPNTEALYQACKFSLYPEIQRLILEEGNPMKAKIISRQHQSFVRQDWDTIKFKVMEWCLCIKLLQYWDKFGSLLRDSGTATIVEYSAKDNIWGATPTDNDTLEGENILGRLLMKIRDEYIIPNKKPSRMSPPNITGFMIYGNLIGDVYSPEYYLDD